MLAKMAVLPSPVPTMHSKRLCPSANTLDFASSMSSTCSEDYRDMHDVQPAAVETSWSQRRVYPPGTAAVSMCSGPEPYSGKYPGRPFRGVGAIDEAWLLKAP